MTNVADRVDLGPLVADYLRIVNDWEGRLLGMDLTIRLVLKKNLPSFVFQKEANYSGGMTNVADTPSKTNDQQHGMTNDHAIKKEAETPLPLSSKKTPVDESTPRNILGSPLKRTRIS